MLERLTRYLTVGDRAWAVRRRTSLAILLMAFAVILHQTYTGTDTARVLGLTGQMVDLIKWTLTVYVTAATAETAVQSVRGPPPGNQAGGQ